MPVNDTLSDPRLVAAFKRFAVVAAILTVAASALVLAGWALNLDMVESMGLGQNTMKPLTAVGLLLAGAGLAVLAGSSPDRGRPAADWPRRLALLGAGVAALLGGLILLEYLAGVDLGIDQLLFRQAVLADGALPIGRPSLAAALCLLLLGLAPLVREVRPGRAAAAWPAGAWLAEAAALVALLVGGLALAGYAYQAAPLYQIGPYVPMAPHTAGLVLLLALATLAARPRGPIVGVLTTNLAGSAISRRLLPIVVAVPFVIGFLRLYVLRLGLLDINFGAALVTVSNIVLFAAIIWASGWLLNLSDARRQSAYAALREREERLRVVADATPNGLLIVDADGRITWANQRAEALFGSDGAQQLLGRAIDDLVPAQFQNTHSQHRATFSAAPQARPMGVGRDLAGRRLDGREFPVEIGLSPIETSQGKLTLASVVDITERQRAETALRQSEERFAKAFRASPAALSITRLADGQIVDVNDQYLQLIGRERAEVIGQPSAPSNLFPDPVQWAALVRRLQATGRVRNLTMMLPAKGGEQRMVLLSAEELELAGEAHVLSTCIDITERMRAEARLSESHAVLHSVLEALSVPIFAVDREYRYTAFNRSHAGAMKALYGADIKLGHSLLDYQTVAADRAGAQANLARVLQGESVVQSSDSGEPGRSRRYFEMSHQPIRGAADEVIGAVVLAADVTERKRAEEDLRLWNAELERRVAARTAELAANEAKLRALFEVLPVGVSILDRDRRIQESNPALARILRLSEAGLAAGAYANWGLIRPDGRPMPAEQLASARAFEEQRPVVNVEMGMVTETGETIWTQDSAAPLPGEGVVVVTTDITERKQVEADLQAANARFQFFVDANLIGVTRSDEHGRLLETNDYYLNVLGYSRQDFEAGRVNWLQLTPPEYLEAEARAIAELKARGKSAPFEKEYIRQDGSRAWVYLSNALLPDGTLAAFILDITERKRSEAELIDSQQRYRALFEEAQRQAKALTLRDLMHQALAGGLPLPEILQVLVEGIASTLGYTLVSLYLLDGRVLKLQHQVGYHQVIASIPPGQGISGRVVRTQQPVFLPDVRLDPDFLGAIEGISSEICVPLFEQGQVAGVLNVESRQGTALTEADLQLMLALGDLVNFALSQARLAAQVRESQQRFAGAFNYATIGMALVAPDGRWLQVNPALCRIVGYSAAELLATNFQAVTHPDDLTADLDHMGRVLAGDINTYQMEKRYLHKLGHLVWILLSVSLVHDAEGQPLYFISQIQDITERKQAEQALAAQTQALATERDLMQALMDNIPDTIYFKDTASRFTRVNRAQAQFLGLPGPEAAIGRTDLEFQEPGVGRELFDEEQRVVMQGQPLLNRVELQHDADGQPRWFTSTKVPLWDGGRVVGLVGVSRDITDMKEAESRLLASLQEKEVLLKEIHHRVKNNLQIVSSLLHLQAESINDPRLRDAFDDSQRRVRSMALIHEQLYRSPDLAHIDFDEYVNGLLVYLRRSQVGPGGQVQFRVQIEQVTLELDRAIPLGLMVNELVTNSLKYAFPPGAAAAPGAEIWVTAARAADGALTVEVGDTGVGLPEALDLDHPASMGLQLVQSFVQQLRGQLRVRRRPGTVFSVTIPERKAARG